MLCKLTCNEITTATQRHLKVNGKRTLFLFKVLVMSTVRCAASLHPNAVTSEIQTKVKYVNTCHPNGLCQAHPPNFRSEDTTISPVRLIFIPLPFPSGNFALRKFSFSL